MKAQALRRTLTLLNVLLVLGLLGAGAWYVLQVRPAQADDGKRAAWVKPAMDAYTVAARNAAPAVVRQVDDKDLEAITRPDLSDLKKGPGVWVFAGPIPPQPKPKVDVPKAPPMPTGLEALGKLVLAVDNGPAGGSVMVFEFTGSKKRRAFGQGDRIEDKDAKAAGETTGIIEVGKPRTPGLYLVSIVRVDAGEEPRFRISYDVVPEDGGAVARQEVVLGIKQELNKGTDVIRSGAGDAAAPGTTAAKGVTAAPAAPATAPPLSDVRIGVERVTDASRKVEFDDAAWRYFKYSDPDQLISDVKTEDAKDAKGDPKGVRLTGVPEGSLASKFDVRPGDILKSINGKPVRSRAEAIDVVKALPKDIATVAVVIERDGRDILYNVDPRDPKTRSAAGKVRYQPGGR
jgi:hypothetical protein